MSQLHFYTACKTIVKFFLRPSKTLLMRISSAIRYLTLRAIPKNKYNYKNNYYSHITLTHLFQPYKRSDYKGGRLNFTH